MHLVSPVIISWILIYPVDSSIQRLNNPGQVTCVEAYVETDRDWVPYPGWSPFKFVSRHMGKMVFCFLL